MQQKLTENIRLQIHQVLYGLVHVKCFLFVSQTNKLKVKLLRQLCSFLLKAQYSMVF